MMVGTNIKATNALRFLQVSWHVSCLWTLTLHQTRVQPRQVASSYARGVISVPASLSLIMMLIIFVGALRPWCSRDNQLMLEGKLGPSCVPLGSDRSFLNITKERTQICFGCFMRL